MSRKKNGWAVTKWDGLGWGFRVAGGFSPGRVDFSSEPGSECWFCFLVNLRIPTCIYFSSAGLDYSSWMVWITCVGTCCHSYAARLFVHPFVNRVQWVPHGSFIEVQEEDDFTLMTNPTHRLPQSVCPKQNLITLYCCNESCCTEWE